MRREEDVTEDILEGFAADAACDHVVDGDGGRAGVDGLAHPAQLGGGLRGAQGGGEGGEQTRPHTGRKRAQRAGLVCFGLVWFGIGGS